MSKVSCVHRIVLTMLLLDFAELNAPPLINYGVVYPQAILIFVVTLLYSVTQPLIVVFGALYFGIGYVVYKYKLLFGEWLYICVGLLVIDFSCSLLQAVRVERAGLAHHIHSSDMGRGHLPDLHGWVLPAEEGVYHLDDYGECGLLRLHPLAPDEYNLSRSRSSDSPSSGRGGSTARWRRSRSSLA